MCSRYSLTSPPEAVRAYFAYRERPNLPQRWNIAPTQEIPVICLIDGERVFRQMRWGLLPHFVKDPKKGPPLINARGEEVLGKPSFRKAVRARRCLVPADGFYEWTGPKGARRPFLLRPADGSLIAFAGVWERWRAPSGETIDTVAVLTCGANERVSALHDRMPVVVAPEDFGKWLDCAGTSAEDALELVRPAPETLFDLVELDPKINNSKIDEPGIQAILDGKLL